MAADQRKKRVNGSNLVSCTSREQYRVKRKKVEIHQQDLNARPNISLVWDDKRKSVVSKREQIGISRRHLIPYVEPSHHSHGILADVLSVPQEIFELENLSEVLSYEVWENCLSEKERDFLSQYLPEEVEPDAIVGELLAGDNFHFGNPFLKWSVFLCAGELHPDNVLHEEKSRKVEKKAYYSELQKYHNDMIENLQLWKEKCASCKDPEVDIVQNIWRSKKHAEKSIPPSETRFCDAEENLIGTPESCSWANSEKACSSDDQNLGLLHGESQQRKGFLNKTSDTSSSGLQVVALSRKAEKLQKRNIQRDDGAKYMSYIKVSKKQHERVKSSMRHAGNSSQPRSLDNVLGSIDTLNVQPFERFEEEESKKLHEYWLKLATNDIPEGFTIWRKRQLLRQQLILSLGEEIEQRLQLEETVQDEEKEVSLDKLTELSDTIHEEEAPLSITIEDVERNQPENLLQHEELANEEADHEMSTEEKDEEEIKNDCIFEEQTRDDAETTEDEDVTDNDFIEDQCQQQQIASIKNSPGSSMITPSAPGFLHDQHQGQLSSLNNAHHCDSVQTEPHCNTASVKAAENMNHVDNSVLPSASSDVWPAAGDHIHGSYYRSSATNVGYATNQELSVGHQQFIQEEQPVEMLDLEPHSQDKEAGKVIQSDDLPFFSSYHPNQDRGELLQAFFKEGQSNLPFQHQHSNHSGLDFQPGNNNLMMEPSAGQFSGHHVHPSLPPMDHHLRQKRLDDLYMHHQNVHESMYSGGVRYSSMPRQENLPVNIHDWATVNSSACMPAQQNWYTRDNGPAHDGWTSFGVSHSENNTDQTLFSVLSECNKLRPAGGGGYSSTGPTERFIQPGNYSGIGGGMTTPSSNFLQQSPNPLQYLSGHEPVGPAGGIKINNLGWMGLPQQNSGLQEPMGKPFLRSWNIGRE